MGWLRQQCGYVPVDPVLFNMTIAENLSLLHRKVSQNRLEEACEKTGILNALRELPNARNHSLFSTGFGIFKVATNAG